MPKGEALTEGKIAFENNIKKKMLGHQQLPSYPKISSIKIVRKIEMRTSVFDVILFSVVFNCSLFGDATRPTTSVCGARKADRVKTVALSYCVIFVLQSPCLSDCRHLVVILHLNSKNPLVQESQTRAVLQVSHSQHCDHKDRTLQQVAW